MSREEMLTARVKARDLRKRIQDRRAQGRTAIDRFTVQTRQSETRHRIVRLRWLGMRDEADALERGLKDAFA